MTRILSDKDVRAVADVPTVIDELDRCLRAEAIAGQARMPERMTMDLGPTLFRVMPALLPAAGVLGLKLFYGSLEEGVRYSVMIAAIDTGEVLAVLDAAYLTALRTGATSGVATRYLAREGARTVGLLGSGLEAESNLAAVCAVRPITCVRVYSRSPDRRRDFAVRMSSTLGIEVEPVDAPDTAVAGADIVVVATNTGRGGGTALSGDWLSPGQHVVSIGSTSPFLREIDATTLLRSDVVVVDASPDQVATESGDVIATLECEPGWRPTGTLDQLMLGSVSRSGDEQLTTFKSVGTAAQDLIAAAAITKLADARDAGIVVPDLNEPKRF